MSGFEDAWKSVAAGKDGDIPSSELKPLLQRVYSDVLGQPLDLNSLKASLTVLLEFLAGPGRTNANCWAADLFFCLSEGGERDWTEQDLPEDFHEVLSLMGEALHDTVETPKVASNFGCLPEQLLAKVKQCRV